MIIRTFIAILFCVAFFSCSKVTTHCDYYVVTLEETASGTPTIPLADVIGYVFDADTLNYSVESYDAAARGELIRRDRAGIKTFLKKTEYETVSGQLTFRSLNAGTFILMVCDTLNEIYAFKQVDILEGIDKVIVNLTFYPYKFESDPDTMVLSNTWIEKKTEYHATIQ